MLVTAELIQEAAADGGVAVGQIVQHRIAVEASQLLNHVARLMGVVHNAVFFALVGEHQASTQNHVIFGPGTFKAELIQFIHGVAVLDVVTVGAQQALSNAARLSRTWVDSIWIDTVCRSIVKTVLLRICTSPVGVAAERRLCTTGIRIPFDIGNGGQLGAINDPEGLLVTVAHNTLVLVKLTTGVLLGFGKVSVKQQVEIIAEIPVNIQAERLVFGYSFVPVLNVIESTVFAHLNNGTVLVDDHVRDATRVKPHTEL